MDRIMMLTIVEQYYRKIPTSFSDVKIIRIADQKTMLIEQFGDSGRAVLLTEYKVDGASCWAGYSSRSQTVYISLAA